MGRDSPQSRPVYVAQGAQTNVCRTVMPRNHQSLITAAVLPDLCEIIIAATNRASPHSSPNPQIIAATNRADILDPALMRSGRLDRKIEFPHPNEDARAKASVWGMRIGG